MKHFAAILPLAAGIFFTAPETVFATPTLPNINTNNIVVITNSPYNAVGDGATDNTLAISNAVVKAASGGTTNGAAGGTVEIPPGIFLSGPIAMKSSINLQVDAGAILRMLPFGQFPGSSNANGASINFISASSVNDVEISGSGAIDGQGTPYWHALDTNSAFLRPILVRFQGCNRQLIQNVTLSNSPMFHISISSSKGNATVQGVTILAPSSSASPQPSHNTDACDVSGTNVLVQNCNISVGDDNFTCSGGTSDVLITNNTYGNGHGVSIGSFTSPSVSNITVINCTFNGTDNGIRIKSDNGRGGLVQNINYYNLGMTNVHFPIQIYGYYNLVGTPSSISPYYASTQAVAAVNSTPAFRNITFSNINATSISGYPIGIIWARTEMPATNIIFNKVNVTGNRNFCLYNVNGAQFIDCNLKPSSTSNTFALFNAQVIITNSTPTNTLFKFDGLTTNGYGNTLAFYNALGSLKNANVFDDGPLTLSASTLTVSNNLNLSPATVLNFTLSTNTAKVTVVGNLTLGGTNNISAGQGFTNGTYTLMTYTGALSGPLPVLGITPPGYNYSIYNSAAGGQVNLLVSLPAPPTPTNLVATATNLVINLKWNSVSGATSYNLKRGTTNGGTYPATFGGLTATNYTDANVTNAVNYFYVVTALGTGGESSNSLQATAAPLPSKQPTNILTQISGNQLQLSWPQNHLGWRLQIQTNDLSGGIGTNWATVANSTNVNSTNIVINPTNGSVFLRLVYP